MTRALPLAVAALLAAGCIPDTSKLDPFASAAAVCPVLFDVVTAKMEACSGLAPYLARQYYTGGTASCGVIAAGEKAGRIGYDRAKAETCINAFNAPGCGSLDNACSDLPFVPQVGAGGVCFNDLECTTASAGCYSPTLTCPGHCLPPGAVASTSRCVSGVDPPCASSLWCDSSGATPICRPRAADGASCATAPCGTSSYCDYSASPYLCKAQLGPNQPCTGYGQCSDAMNLYCNAAGTCSAINLASPMGGRCDWPNQCAANLWCDYSASPQATCKTKLANNVAGCTNSNACSAAGSACLIPTGSSSGACAPLKLEGASCTQGPGECQRGLSCYSGDGLAPRCTRWPGLGGPCGSVAGEYVSCASGFHCSIVAGGSSGACAANVAAGQPCPNYDECGNDGMGFVRTQCLRSPSTGALTCVAPCSPP